jgi:putative CocE/NonD family hydrolase
LTFKTEPMTEDLTIVGPVWADLFVTSTSTDADFVVKVIDVFPDDASDNLGGYEMLVRGEIMRAKFRNNPTKPSPLTPGKIEKVSYALPDVFHTFKKGHRMMVQVQSSWFPLGDRNPQKFMDIWKAKAEDFTKATIQLHHSSKSASRIRVGVLHP